MPAPTITDENFTQQADQLAVKHDFDVHSMIIFTDLLRFALCRTEDTQEYPHEFALQMYQDLWYKFGARLV